MISPVLGKPRRTGEHAPRRGGRSERVVSSVLASCAAELSRKGYAALRIEDVASRAGVNKTTVYRRWPTKADLVAATLRANAATVTLDREDRDNLREELVAFAQQTVKRMRSLDGSGCLRMLLLEGDNPEVGALARALREEFHLPWLAALSRAVARGELPADVNGSLMVEMIGATISNRTKSRLYPVDDAFIESVVDLVLRGAGFKPRG